MPRDVGQAPRIATVTEVLGDNYTDKIRLAFPDVKPPFIPCGNRILVQLRTPGNFKTFANGTKLYFPDESTDAEKFRTQTALVRAIGPVAFKNRATMADWPEGDWCVPGEFVRTPMYGGDRVAVPLNDEWKREALFMTMNDTDVIGVICDYDPLDIKTLL